MEFEKIKTSELSVKQASLEFLEEHFEKIYSDNYAEKIENCLIEMLNDDKDWNYINAAISIFTVILSSKIQNKKKSFEALIKLFVDKYENLCRHQEYRLRVNIQKLTKLLILTSDDRTIFKKFTEILLNDILNNLKISKSLGIFSHLEDSSNTNSYVCKKDMCSSPKVEKNKEKDCCPDYLINSPRNQRINKQSEPLSK